MDTVGSWPSVLLKGCPPAYALSPSPPPAYWQVRDLAARSQARKNKDKADDDSSAAVNQPQRWSDYTVEFHFPEPSELAPPLIQLIDVDFKYPSRWEGERGGLAIGVCGGEGRGGRLLVVSRWGSGWPVC